VVDSDFDTVLEVVAVDFPVEADKGTLVEGFPPLIVEETTLKLVDDFTLLVIVEELLELRLVEDTVLPALLDLTFAHTNCVCPISHAPLILKDSKTMLSIAFKFAPEKELKRTVYVWVTPVMPVRVVK
jgi:hypothetical protein